MAKTTNPIAFAKPPVQKGWVRLWATDPDFDIYGPLSADTPHWTGGWGGWEVVPRPRQSGMTIWNGIEPFTLEFGMWLDRGIMEGPTDFNQRRSIEQLMDRLLRVARGDGDSPPSPIYISGIPRTAGRRWIIEAMDFPPDGAIRRSYDMYLVRQQINFVLKEYTPPTMKRIHKQALKRDLGKIVTIKVKKDDTPARIARRRGCKWTDLRTLNPGVVHKAAQNLKNGIKLRVPARERRGRGGRRGN
jgi:hypothetical protein